MQGWIPVLKDWLDSFITYFQAQAPPVQLMLGIMVILGFIGLGFVIYGALWLTFQVIKAAIVGTVLLVYLAGAAVGCFFMLFLDPARIPATWIEVKRNMAWWIDRTYPPRHPRPAASCDHRDAGDLPACPLPTTRIVIEPGVASPVASRVNRGPRNDGAVFFCTSCGTPFSTGMQGMLVTKQACFCETCGQQFITKAVPAAAALSGAAITT